jgi:hypothetical protein
MQNYQVKSTKNVLRWLTLATSLLLVSSLTGCASFSLFGDKVKPIEVVAKPLNKTALAIADPDPIKTKPITWVIVTPENAEQIFKDMDTKGQNLVLFAITDDGYQQLALTIADLRNFINTQRTIIIKYKDYYEPQKEPKK